MYIFVKRLQPPTPHNSVVVSVVVNPLTTNGAYMCHETFNHMMSLSVMSLEDVDNSACANKVGQGD